MGLGTSDSDLVKRALQERFFRTRKIQMHMNRLKIYMQPRRPNSMSEIYLQLKRCDFAEFWRQSIFPNRPFWVGQDLQKSNKAKFRKFVPNKSSRVHRPLKARKTCLERVQRPGTASNEHFVKSTIFGQKVKFVKIAIFAPLNFDDKESTRDEKTHFSILRPHQSTNKISVSADIHKVHFETSSNRDFGLPGQVPTKGVSCRF